MDPKRYLRILAAAWALVLAGAGAFNLVVDPFHLFGLVRVAGFNADKPEFGSHARMAKAHRVRLVEPRGLILGSSRAEMGLDPRHPGWDASPVYNLALPSGSVYEAYRYLLHAHAAGEVRQVVLALDLFMFNARFQTEPDFSEARLASPGGDLGLGGWLRDLATALFTFDAIAASAHTLDRQGTHDFVPYLPLGGRHPTANRHRVQAKGGHHAAFLGNERYSLTAPDGWALFTMQDPAGGGSTLETLDRLVAFCAAEGIDLRMLISPVHARKLEVLWQLGLWPELERWKRGLAAIAGARAAAAGGPIPLWDFSGYRGITTETLPPPGDAESRMRWYWEGSHYTRRTGDLVLDRVLGGGAGVPEGFGVRLSLDSIDRHLARIRQDRRRYAADHPDDIAEIGRQIAQTAERRRALVGAAGPP